MKWSKRGISSYNGLQALNESGKLAGRDGQHQFGWRKPGICARTNAAKAHRYTVGLHRAWDNSTGRTPKGRLASTLQPVHTAHSFSHKHGLLGINNAEDDISRNGKKVETAIDDALMSLVYDRQGANFGRREILDTGHRLHQPLGALLVTFRHSKAHGHHANGTLFVIFARRIKNILFGQSPEGAG